MPTSFSPDLIRAMEPVARELLGEPTEEIRSKNELRFGTRGSLSINLDKGAWYDHETGKGGGVLDLVQDRRNVDKDGAVAWLRDHGHLPADTAKPSNSGRIVATYDYTDPAGDLLFQVVRYEPKDFRQRRPNGNGSWIWKMASVQLGLYRLPEVIAAVAAGRTVFVVEGEKAADALVEMGVTATCSPGGAGKWRAAYGKPLTGADVVILPDNDPQATEPDGTPRWHPDGRPKLPGQDHAADVAKMLRGIAAQTRVVMLPGLPLKGDAADWVAAGGTVAQLEDLTEAAPTWTDTRQVL